MTKAKANRRIKIARLITAPRFFFSRIQESFQKPTGGPAIRSPSCRSTSSVLNRSGVGSRRLVSITLLLLCSGDANSRVYDPIRDVLKQEGDHEEDREEYRRAEDHRVVVDEDRLHELLPDPRHSEDLLDYQSARYQVDGQRRENGDERYHGVPHGVLDDNCQAGEPLGLRQGDVVLAQNLEHQMLEVLGQD